MVGWLTYDWILELRWRDLKGREWMITTTAFRSNNENSRLRIESMYGLGDLQYVHLGDNMRKYIGKNSSLQGKGTVRGMNPEYVAQPSSLIFFL